MKRFSHVPFSPAIFLITVLILCGCNTTGKRQTINVALLPGNKCRVADSVVSIDKMNRALKSAGAGAETRIRISLQEKASEESTRALARRLSAWGYRRIYFQTPRRAVSYIAPDKASGPAAPGG